MIFIVFKPFLLLLFYFSFSLFLLCPLQKSKDSRKGPVVILSITYRGVKFIDAATKVIGQYVGASLCLLIWSRQTLQLIVSVQWLIFSQHSSPVFVHQTIVAEHEIRNISCAAQDPDDLCTFAYITKDLKSGHHFCHVFSTVEVVSNTTLSFFICQKKQCRVHSCLM